MSKAMILALAAGFGTFFFFMSFTGNVAQSEFFFCIFAGIVAGLITFFKVPHSLRS